MPSKAPVPLPAWFWLWAHWRDLGGVPAERPPDVPAQLPPWAWDRYRVHRGTLELRTPFDGQGVLVVDSSAFDPATLFRRIPNLTAVCMKVGGDDVGTPASDAKLRRETEARGLAFGLWLVNTSSVAADMRLLRASVPAAFVVHDVEQPYKRDEGGDFALAAQLVAAMHEQSPLTPVAVTSYGHLKTSIDFGAFARAGWHAIPQGYDSFTVADASSYAPPFPLRRIHPMARSLTLPPGQWCYRPESDGL